eukprot:TRINITY_DN837_c0_g1_i3.p1 TRINITY_DN837_c0_g1~~TRINITY_DN837_c0_g1_i3.p1  ORF type:complete len:141 (-),score=7.35 TRINITY_DN837_c0_g1_i3:193-615(-)
MASPIPPRPIVGDLYHSGSLINVTAPPPPLPHHQFYCGPNLDRLHRTLDRVAAYDHVARAHGEPARQGEPVDLALNYHPRSWRNPPVNLDDLLSAADYQSRNSTASHIMDTFSRSRELQADLLHYRSLGFDYHVLPVGRR